MVPETARALPVTREECLTRGWDEIDVVLVSGDAYVDHPSFGIALIGRLLEAAGYRVAVLPQPRFDKDHDFRRFGRPRLFFGISGGNLDSIVANYSGNGKIREVDAYSPEGRPWRSQTMSRENRYRPDRAVLRYANLARSAYPETTIILGGIEASLRRFIHYDYKQARLRSSHLADAKGDLLIYGMAEKAVLEAADRLDNKKSLDNIRGTCVRRHSLAVDQFIEDARSEGRKVKLLPGWQDIASDIDKFMEAERAIDRQSRAFGETVLLQRQQACWIVQYPPQPVLSTREMDELHELPYTRKPHPSTPNIPAHTMIQHSITIVRGCYGNCSFCAIARHQGPRITSRSPASILVEAEKIAARPEFGGTISDLGGPTANLYGTSCTIGSCRKHDCLYPRLCKNLVIDEPLLLELLEQVSNISQVKHLHISSGLRMGLLQQTPALLERLLRDHTPGNLKIAPEHTEELVLELMHKEPHAQLIAFVSLFNKISRRLKNNAGLTPYIISAHPGCTEQHNRSMVKKLKKLGLTVRQFQDFTPTPGTLSTAMYVTGQHRDKRTRIEVARNKTERTGQRRVIEDGFFKGGAPEKNQNVRRQKKRR